MNQLTCRVRVAIRGLLTRLHLLTPDPLWYVGGSDTLPPPLSPTEETYLLRDDRQVWADAICVYRGGKLSPGAVFLLRPRPDEVTGGYLCGYTGVLVFPAESEEEAKTMFSDTVWKHWQEEYGYVTAILPF